MFQNSCCNSYHILIGLEDIMTETAHHTTYRKDYSAPYYSVASIDLRFELGEETTVVTSRMALKRQTSEPCPLVLTGTSLVMREVKLDGAPLAPDRYSAKIGRAHV